MRETVYYILLRKGFDTRFEDLNRMPFKEDSNMKTRRFTKALALLLCLCMCISMLPSKFTLAEEDLEQTVPQGEAPEVIVTKDGEIEPDEDWNETFQFGTFAFGHYQADIAEPGVKTADGQEIPQSVLIPVYRLGGTVGKAIVHIHCAPAVTMDEYGEEYVYDYAASGLTDLLIEAEDPNPIAAYQQLGVSDKELNTAASDIRVNLPELSEEVSDTDELKLTLSDAPEADAYRWQCNDRNGWRDIIDAETDELTVTWSDLWDFEADTWTGMDFRCIYEKDGALFCTVSLLGEVYESPYPDPDPVPADIVVPDEPGYSAITFENEYDSVEFELIFADGETVKYVRVTALEDEIPELPEMCLFTIARCEGGEMSDTGNTLTLMVSDNEAPEPSELGFSTETVEADRAEGVAKVKVTRTGGKSYPVTVHYVTEDGTALAGIDYAKTEGDLAFSGSIDEIEIAVPLITRYTTEEKQFSIVLSDIRGGGAEHPCTLSTERTEVTVFGSASETNDRGEGQNLATLLTDINGRDASGNITRAEDALIDVGTEPSVIGDVIMPEPKPVKATFTVPEQTRLYHKEGCYSFTRAAVLQVEQGNEGTSFWRDWDDIMGDAGNCYNGLDHTRSNNNLTSWSFLPDGGEDLGKIKYTVGGITRDFGGKYYTTAIDTNYRGQAKSSWNDAFAPGDYYDQLLMSFGWVSPGLRKTGAFVWRHRYLRPKITLTVGGWTGTKFFDPDTSTGRTQTSPNKWETYCRLKGRNDWQWNWDSSYHYDDKYDVPDGPYLDFGESFKIDLDFQFYDAWTTSESHTYNKAITESNKESWFDVRAVSGHRRVFNQPSIDLNLYTANDADEGNGFTVIPEDSSLYKQLAPVVSIVPDQGGVNTDNKLYVGTTLRIEPSGQAKSFAVIDDGIYMTDKDGNKVCTMTRNSDGTWDCKMIWDGMTGNDLNSQLTLNVVYNRKQTITIDVSHSVPQNDDGTINDAAAAAKLDELLQNGITLQVSELPGKDGKMFDTKEVTWTQESAALFTKVGAGVYETILPVDNPQTICFMQDPADVVLHEGSGYAGNARIPLQNGDFSTDTLTFVFYDADYLDVTRPMTVLIDHVDVYFDKNGDGKISGDLDEFNIFQIETDPETGEQTDTFIDRFAGDYPDSIFAPVLDDDGKIHQYFFMVFVTTGARSLVAPPDYTGDGNAQLLPAFISAVTDQLEEAKLTKEQLLPRYIRGSRLDDFPMFGAETTKLRVIEIPLGGDIGKMEYNEVTNGIYDDDGNMVDAETVKAFTWEPNFIGNLLIPFSSPAPIIDTENVTGGEVAIAGENPTQNADGTYAYTEQGLIKINGYLGAFVGRSAFTIGIQEQKKPINAAEGQTALSSMEDIDPETVEIGTVRSVPDANSLANTEPADDPGDTEGAGPQNNNDTNQFQQNLGTKLPGLQIGVGNYATVIIDGYTIGFAVSIPILKKEKSWMSDEQDNTTTDGANKRTWTDQDGTVHEEYTYTSNNNEEVKATVTTKVDPSDPTKRTKTIVTETTAQDGRRTRRTEVREQKLENGQWKGERKTIKSTDLGMKPNKVEEASGIGTLKDFCTACKTADSGMLNSFMSGNVLGDSYQKAKNGHSTTKGTSATFSVQLAIMFEYNPIDNCHYFKNAGVSAMLDLNFTQQFRFVGCPIIYLYMKLGLEIKASMGLTCYRTAEYGAAIDLFTAGGYEELLQGGEMVFELDMRNNHKKYRGFVINLKGKVLMQLYDNAECSGDALASGTLAGDGGEREVLLKAYDKIIYVRLTPADSSSQTVTSRLRPIKGAKSKVAFDGLTIEPSLSAEFGAGVGIEIVKFEVFIKVSTSIALTMGGYLQETDTYEGFYVSDFKATVAVGINLTLVFFNFSLDAISIGSEGKQHGTGGYFDWDSKITALARMKTLKEWKSYTAADGKLLGTTEPQVPSSGVNIFKDNANMHFYKSNGDPVDVSENAPTDQGWTFRKNVLPWRWKGGDFIGETPQNHDLSEADKDDVFVKFTPQESKIKLYFSGKVRVFIGSDTTGKEYKSSPAKINVGSGNEVKILLKKGAKLDRYEDASSSGTDSTEEVTRKAESSLVHISGPTDITGTQKVVTPTSDTRAITPLGTEDFQLSGYNTSGDAKELVKGLATGYDYLLVKAGTENYLFYPLMIDGSASNDDPDPAQKTPQLVVSKLVMTGDLSQGTGLEHPITGGTEPAYLVVDNDSYTDLSFDAVGSQDELLVSWITHDDADGDTYAVKQRKIPLSVDAELPEIETLYIGSDPCTLPVAENGRTVWVSANGDGSYDNAKLKSWLIARNDGLTEEILDNPDQAFDPMLATAVFQWVTLSAVNTMNGDSSVLNVKIGDNVLSDTLSNRHVQNIETATIGDKIYLLYSTTQTVYMDTTQDVPITVGPDDIDRGTEKADIHQLYLRTVDPSGFSEAICIQSVVDYDTCTTDTIESSRLKDGVYTGGSLEKEQADPYYANLHFVTAAFDNTGVQTMAFFEMGGNTWMISQSDLYALVNGINRPVEIRPIFSEPAGTDVAIGSDGNNLAIVYTAPVSNSLSNAIFISWWNQNDQNDQNEGAWGSPTILAMRGLQIYEDRITYDMSPEDTEKAYLGKLTTGSGATGSMDKLVFSNLQMSTAKMIHDGIENEQLIILTTGALTNLKEATVNEGAELEYDTVIPDGKASIGFYAIGFGMGEQALGEGDLDFSNCDFTTGSRLIGEVKFRNTGTAAIRASEVNPLTVRLMVTAGAENSPAQEIAKWQLTKSVASGKQVKLLFESLPLSGNLQKGATFYLDIEEDAYFTDNYHGTVDDLFIVKAAPELSFSNFDLELREVRDGIATFTIDATVVNNGSACADNVFIQFSYDIGENDEYGNRIYHPIDITGSDLKTGIQTAVRGVRMQEDFTNGIYKLNGSDGTNIDIGYGRTVTGLLCVPAESFVSKEDVSGLHIKAEIYSESDTPNFRYGVYSSDHSEYNKTNNRFEQTIKHHTALHVPDRITTALGTTLVLPITFHSTGDNPDLKLTEISDGTPDWTPRMGICYYDAERRVIVAAPNSTAQALIDAGEIPTGILQLKDMDTNTIEQITYRITSMTQGVNIFRDDASFTFYDADGEETILYPKETDDPGWSFLNKGVSTGWTGGEPGEIPMNHDLSQANEDGAYFIFESVADTMQFYFMGEITVESSLFGTQTFTSSPAMFVFDNPTGAIHEIKVTAKAGTRIDRYVATYKDDPVIDPDPDAPQVLWNRSFPDVASVLEDGSVAMTCYITDQSGITNVIFKDQKLSETTTPALHKFSDTLWYFDYTFTDNDEYRIRVTDIVGNTAESTVHVEWFNSVLSTGANADAPEFRLDDLSVTDPNGNPAGMDAPKNYTPWLKSGYALREDEQSKAMAYTDGVFSDTPLDKAEEERWLIGEDGIYQVRVDRADGTWARAIVLIDGIDTVPPTLTVKTEENRLRINATDNRSIASLTVNGYPLAVNGSAFKGFFPLTFTGDYTVSVADAAGNVTEKTVRVEVPLAIKDMQAHILCPNGNISTEVTVQKKDLIGGEFDPAISDPAQGVYDAPYEIALAPEDATEPPESGWTPVNESCTLTVEEGVYVLFVRDDAGNTAQWPNALYLYHPESWKQPTYEWTETETGYDVTATTVCALDATHTETETVQVSGVVAEEPTCEADGVMIFTATFENDLFAAQVKYVPIPKIGHEWQEPTYNWTYEEEYGWIAEATSVCAHDPEHIVFERVAAELSTITEPTCEEEGEMLCTGTFEDELFTTQTMTQPIPPTGHDWGEPTYEWVETETGYTVTATTVCKHDPSHIGTETNEATYAVVTPPTTKADGLGRFTVTFTDERFTTQTKDIVLPMLLPTFFGGNVLAADVTEYTDDGAFCRYDVMIRNVDVDRNAVSMQVFVGYDPSILTFVEARTAFEGNLGVNDTDGTVRFAWATDGNAIPLPDGTVVVSLYFAIADDVPNGTIAALTFGEETGFAYLDETGGTAEADPVLYEDGSIQLSVPESVTIAGEDVIANDIWIREDGELLYRYDLRIRDLPEAGLMVNSAQIFLTYDETLLSFRKAEGAVDWIVSEKNGKLLCAWASDTEVLMRNDDIVLTLWFAKGGNAQPGAKADITFTVNSLNQPSSVSFLFMNRVSEVDALTIDGSITFEAPLYGDANCDGMITAADAAMILRSIVELSELSRRGMLNADVDGDGEVTAADAALVLRFVIGLIPVFPVETP